MARFENVKDYIGARVIVENRDELFDSDFLSQCRQKLDERTVLVFPQIHLTDEEQLRFTDLFGGRVKVTSTATTNQDSDVYKVTLDKDVNAAPEYVIGTFFWHMDGLTVDIPPPKASLLSARKISAKGGQTEFASTSAAYEHLPDDAKAELEGLRGVHSVKASLRYIADLIPEEDHHKLTIGLIKDHPLVWSRRNGRKTLVIGTTTDEVLGMDKARGRALLLRLQEWAAQPAFSYRHQWQEGDFVVWDNCGAMHRVIPYDADSGRMMHRTSLAGDELVT